MPLLTIPTELVLQIARCLLRCPKCHCQHISSHVSVLSRSNRHLHALLAEFQLTTASTLHMLLWGIAYSRPDTVTIALTRGADPNSPSRPNPYMPANRSRRIGTPVEIAIRMRVHSVDAESHALKLQTVALLFAAGGTCTTDCLMDTTRYGDLDLLTLCLGYLAPTDTSSRVWLGHLLEIAIRFGHVESTRMLIGAGAPVNSVGAHPTRGYYPPLWVCSNASIAVLEVLLDAGADPTWCSQDNHSIVQNMRLSAQVPVVELEAKIALLKRYGAVDEAPLWDWALQWTSETRWNQSEYRGWIPDMEKPDHWVESLFLAGIYGGCGCLSCPLQVTGGGYRRAGRAASGGHGHRASVASGSSTQLVRSAEA